MELPRQEREAEFMEMRRDLRMEREDLLPL